MTGINLAERIERRLPPGLIEFLQTAGSAAQPQRLCLVGGVVRDLLLERENLDIDLVVEGDAIALAGKIASRINGEVTSHARFGTAKIRWGSWSADLATARAETYAKPGALPSVKPGSIENDLYRRDFTINAMAVRLDPDNFGELLDPHGGRKDLVKRLVRILHDKSFTDDATRIWRALRYEQRLDFRLEPGTLKLLRGDTDRLDTVSGDRIRHELELVLGEEVPEKALQRAGELGVLQKMHPSLGGNGWLAEAFALARESTPELPLPSLYLALLAYRLDAGELEQLIEYLKPNAATAQILRDTIAIKAKSEELAVPGQAPSRIYALLHSFSTTALTANIIGAGYAAGNIALYRDTLRHARTALGGEDVKNLGIPEGPKIKEVLQRLLEARLDGLVSSRPEEEAMVREWLK